MTGQDEGPGREDSPRRVIRVPDPEIVDRGSHDDDVLVSPADIGSASRSCLAIIVALLIIALLLCVFILAQPFLD
jgi:hypothetical protein